MKDEIFVSQIMYARNIMKKNGMENDRYKCTHVASYFKLTTGNQGVNVDQSLYRSIAGSLLHLTASRLDITFSIGCVCVYVYSLSSKSQVEKLTIVLCNIWIPTHLWLVIVTLNGKVAIRKEIEPQVDVSS